MAKIKKVLLVILVAIVPFCLGAAGLKEAYNCGQAAQLLQINADAYHTPAPTVEEILGGLSPYAPLTHMEGCEMILRAFGPLPDVQEGVRYYAKYLECAFTDVPEYGREAVENLTNAGLYIPEDNNVFGPNQLMTEHELAVLIDRIHAYLQSSPKDDYYSWATAELLNDPLYMTDNYDTCAYHLNDLDNEVLLAWIFDMFNDCLENPDTPEKANIAAYLSTFMDQEGRENSLQFIKPFVDAIWNAEDFEALTDICANISRETGIELLLTKEIWSDWGYDQVDFDSYNAPVKIIGYYFFTDGNSSLDNEKRLNRYLRFLSYFGFDKDEIETGFWNFTEYFLKQGQIVYDSSPLSKEEVWLSFNEDYSKDFAGFDLEAYLKKADFFYIDSVPVEDYAQLATTLTLMSKPENLGGLKQYLIFRLLLSFNYVIPPQLCDLIYGLTEPHFAADFSSYYEESLLLHLVMTLFQVDSFSYYSKTDHYRIMHEYLEELCLKIKSYYRKMLENNAWINAETKAALIEKLDTMEFELLIPQDMSGLFRVDYVSAQDGGTLFENLTKFLKELRKWLSEYRKRADSKYEWSVASTWVLSSYYSRPINKFFITPYGMIASHVGPSSSDEEIMGYLGFCIAHEISHGFDYIGSLDLWSEADREAFVARCKRLVQYISDYEVFPGLVLDGENILNECVADLRAMKCIMSIAAEKPDFDYKTFFASLADIFAISATRAAMDAYLKYDVHAEGRCRVNKLLSLTDEFYTTFDIQPGDAMYVAPEERPIIW